MCVREVDCVHACVCVRVVGYACVSLLEMLALCMHVCVCERGGLYACVCVCV